ncbi:hypothetical protein ADIS_2106 [Lunatimonas lonarensis]|uniref:Uncharacterized protein n=1 Tax=Lunatimonas lonarensis TaxID=1232681 RepID=R7ZTK3_9BACT|nr:hypothetical protein ADIS_2106 [Lunatimonas lonarensis]
MVFVQSVFLDKSVIEMISSQIFWMFVLDNSMFWHIFDGEYIL